jgi:hypothetical protein
MAGLWMCLVGVPGFAQGTNTIATTTDLAEGLGRVSWLYAPVTPWDWELHQTDETPWWTGFTALPVSLADAWRQSEVLLEGIKVLPVTLTRGVTGDVVVRAEQDGVELTRVPASDGLRLDDAIYAEVTSRWQRWKGTEGPEVWAVFGPFEPPTLVLHAWLADAQNRSQYDAQLAADRKSERDAARKTTTIQSPSSPPLLSLESNCVITNELDAFVILDIVANTNGWMTVTWESCTDHDYVVYANELIESNDLWVARAAMRGVDGSTSWTDETAAASGHRFYRVGRLTLTGDEDGDGMPNDWEVEQGFNPVDPADANGDTDDDFWLDGAEAFLNTTPTNGSSHPAYTFVIKGGAEATSTPELEITLPDGMTAEFCIVAEDILLSNAATNGFASEFGYTLQSSTDGVHSVYLRLLKLDGTPSAMMGGSILVDVLIPSVTVLFPTNGSVTSRRRLILEGVAADAGDIPPQQDASKPLPVTVNGQFANSPTQTASGRLARTI